MTDEELSKLDKLEREATPGPWASANMVTGDPAGSPTPKEIGEYVENSVIKSKKESGRDAFLFVWAEHVDGGHMDIALTGNGPRGPWNTKLIAALRNHARELIDAAKSRDAAWEKVAARDETIRQINTTVKVQQERIQELEKLVEVPK